MIKFEHRGKKVNSGDLRTPVTFFEYRASSGFDPGQKEKRELFKCYAQVDKVWMRDLEQAKTNGTLDDITIRIRDPYGSYMPDNKHFLEVDYRGFEGKRYNIKTVQPDTQNIGFILVVAGLST